MPATAVPDSVQSHAGANSSKPEVGEVLLPPDEVLKNTPN